MSALLYDLEMAALSATYAWFVGFIPYGIGAGVGDSRIFLADVEDAPADNFVAAIQHRFALSNIEARAPRRVNGAEREERCAAL